MCDVTNPAALAVGASASQGRRHVVGSVGADPARGRQGGPRQAMWRYEPEQPKRKHHWLKSTAGYVEVHGVVVGKCPHGLPLTTAEALLNDGVEWRSRRNPSPWPSRIYAVHEGFVFRATPTVPGVSYHAFPEILEHFPVGSAGRQLKTELLQRAVSLHCEDPVRSQMGW